ncbi:putative metal-nicotianamine transporter YSL7 isoform X1 [Apium graveolens]|uniref:putative metal-nicotianamine transporter YSL7 isoform X1 n=1 Tax=Apium graveolens TaxID=4045 RepID=UPI003D78C75B
MSETISKQVTEANDSQNTKSLSFGWIIGFLFTVSFLGLFSVLSLRKIMIIDYKLIYPNGIATAHLINSFHTPQGAKLAKEQVKALGKFLSFSLLWGVFQWFFAAGSDCGSASLPSLGLKAYEDRVLFIEMLSLETSCSPVKLVKDI